MAIEGLIAELRRRRVFRVLVGYGLVSFALLQIIEPIMHALHLPDEVLTYSVLALALGFPVAVVLAWAFDVNAGGLESTPPASARSGLRGPLLALLLVGLGLLAAAPGVAWYFLRARPHAQVLEPAAPPGPAPAGKGGPSIAVLPFVDLSPGKDQEYLSDGLAEEILTALSRIEGLRIAGRTSSFYFKGKGARLADIGRELQVSTVLEGGVRREGNRIRVTATVVNTADGVNAWSESYDRELTDILAVESEIARSVAAALRVKLLGKAASAPAGPKPVSTEAHLQLLLGRNHLARGSPSDLDKAVEAYRAALKLEPELPAAWAGLAQALYFQADTQTDLPALLAKKRAALETAEKAARAGPDAAEALHARGELRAFVGFDWSGGLADLNWAVALEPNDGGHQLYRAIVLGALGRQAEATAGCHRALELDPLDSQSLVFCAWLATGAEQNVDSSLREARTFLLRAQAIAPDNVYAPQITAEVLLLQHKADEALSSAQSGPGPLELAARLFVEAASQHASGHRAESQRAFDELVEKYGNNAAFQIAEVCAARGDPDGAFLWLDRAVERLDGGLIATRFSPFLRSLHRDPRWKRFLAKINLPVD